MQKDLPLSVKGSFYIQAGAFSKKSNAEALPKDNRKSEHHIQVKISHKNKLYIVSSWSKSGLHL